MILESKLEKIAGYLGSLSQDLELTETGQEFIANVKELLRDYRKLQDILDKRNAIHDKNRMTRLLFKLTAVQLDTIARAMFAHINDGLKIEKN